MKDAMVAGRMAAALLCAAGLGLTGCTSSVSGGTASTISANAATTMTQTILTDAPADQVLALGLTVDSIVLTDKGGASTTVLSSPTPVEASHLDAVHEPLLPPLKVPQDTYVSATITVANPVVAYVDSTTKQIVKANAVLTAASTTVTFTTPIVVGTTASPIVFDLMVGPSVSITGTGASTVVDVTPTFDVRQVPLGANPPTNNNNGKVSGVIGMVSSVSGTTLGLTTANGNLITLTTDGNTKFQGVSGLSALQTGEIVSADYAQEANGTLLAMRVRLFDRSAQDVFAGVVTGKTGAPVTSFTELVRQPIGPGMTYSSAAATYTMNVTSSTTFEIDPQLGTLPTLPVAAAFTASTIFAGQNVATVASAVSGTTATATTVTLLPQTIGGTVTAVTTTGGFTAYTVTLPSPSALATLTGASTATVYLDNNSQRMTAAPIAVGATARFNGLLFSNGGSLVMYAGSCSDGQGAPPPQKH